MKRLPVFLLLLLLCLMATSPAHADKPFVNFDRDYDDDFLVANCADYGGPSGFELRDHTVGHESDIWYLDTDGNVEHAVYHNSGVDNVYIAGLPNVVSGHFSQVCVSKILTHPPATPYWSWNRDCTGTPWNIELPGYGAVLHQSGPIVVYVIDGVDQQMLKQKGLSQFDIQAMCSALTK